MDGSALWSMPAAAGTYTLPTEWLSTTVPCCLSTLTVTQLADAVGMRTSAVSNQLQRLVDKGVLAARRDGNRIWYRISDPCVVGLIDLAWCLVEPPDPGPATGRPPDRPRKGNSHERRR